MKINLLAIGKSMPNWVTAGYQEYAQRLSKDWSLRLIEIPSEKRSRNLDIVSLQRIEGERMLAKIPTNSLVIALEVNGKAWATTELASRLQRWHEANRELTLLIGGPEGLPPACLAIAEQSWSLSTLTLPHPLVRIVVAEQLYRAWSILHQHPYHR